MAIISTKQTNSGSLRAAELQTPQASGVLAGNANRDEPLRHRKALKQPDLCVIGAGAGGLSVAAAAAALGVSVVLIEKHEMGGDCLNYGCVPSKALIAAAQRVQAMRTSSQFGVSARTVDVDFTQVRAHIRGVVDEIKPNDSAERFAAMGVDVIHDTARFIDRKTVETSDFLVRARRFVIATGSAPHIPAISGLAAVPFWTNETIFDNDQPVGHLLVLGGGVVGLEIGQAYRRLGAQVTILEKGQALANDDPELAAVVKRSLTQEGIGVIEGASVRDISGRAGAIRVAYHIGSRSDADSASHHITGTHLFVATGRKPNIDNLGLDAAAVRSTPRGISVMSSLRSSNRRVYAIGDVAGGAQATHIANHHASVVVRSALFRLPARVAVDRFPRVTFTDPELAYVGLTEAEARVRCGKVAVYRAPFCDNDRAMAEREGHGMIKVVCDHRGAILGAGIVGNNAGELIHVWSLALSQRLKIGAMGQWIAPYPTYGELSRRVALMALADQARRPIVRKLLSFLRKFG